MRVDGNMTNAPNYFPNSFSGPKAAQASHSAWHKEKITGDMSRHPTGDIDNFTQARETLWRNPSNRETDSLNDVHIFDSEGRAHLHRFFHV